MQAQGGDPLNPVETIKKAMTYINAHLSETLSCNLIAKKFHYSEFHFHRLFQYVTNMSVTDYIRCKRLHAIANKLLKTHETVLNLCLAYGFNNQRTFHRAFKAQFGITPTYFKLQNTPTKDESPEYILEKFHARSANESWAAAQKLLPIALQVYSVQKEAEHDFKGTMKKVKSMGYDYIELCLNNDLSADYIRETLDSLYLGAVSAHVSFDELNANSTNTINACKTIGCKYIVIPYLANEYRPQGPKYQYALDSIRKIGSDCANNGMILLYHNHDYEFNLMPDGRYSLDHLYGDIPAELLQAQLDTGWIKAAGLNPVDFFERCKMRVPMIHLKDLHIQGKAVEFMPIGHGIQEIPAILTAAVACGVEWIVVEQDHSLAQPPLEAIQKSRDYLHGLGW